MRICVIESRPIALLATVAFALLALGGCGGSGSDTSGNPETRDLAELGHEIGSGDFPQATILAVDVEGPTRFQLKVEATPPEPIGGGATFQIICEKGDQTDEREYPIRGTPPFTQTFTPAIADADTCTASAIGVSYRNVSQAGRIEATVYGG